MSSSNLKYPSELQKRYANTVLPELPNDLIIEILAKTDDESFKRLCRSAEFQSYCSSNSIFSERIYEERAKRTAIRKFDEKLLKLKPKGMSWRAFNDGMLDVIEKLENPDPYRDDATALAKEGKFMGLIIYNLITNRLPNEYAGVGTSTVNLLVQKGRYDILKWLEEKGVLIREENASTATAYGHLGILKWLVGKGYLPQDNAVDNAAAAGHLAVLKFLDEKGIRPTQYGAEMAQYHGRRDVVDWLASKGIYPR